MSRRSLALVALSLASTLLFGNVRSEDKFVEGQHYRPVTTQQRIGSAADRIEVAVVFMYSCPHCFTFEPYLSEWIRTKPSYVDVIFLPAWWTETAKLHARAYYAAETLGVIEKMHEDFFHAIYVEKRDLSTQSGLRDFFGSYGIEPAKFDAALASPEVAKRSQRADALIKGYGVMGTPTVVVNGKYLTTLPWADRSFETWFKIVDELVAREHAALSASAVAK